MTVIESVPLMLLNTEPVRRSRTKSLYKDDMVIIFMLYFS